MPPLPCWITSGPEHLALPTSHFALTALAGAVFNRALEHPLGSFGGGLSWPFPLSPERQRTLVALDVNATFNEQFNQAIDSRKKGITATIKHLIAQLPLPDRQNLEYAKLEFYQNNTYTLGTGLFGRTLEEKNQTLLVKASGVAGETVYKIDLKQGAITGVPGTELTQQRQRTSNRVYPIEKFTPTRVGQAQWLNAAPTAASLPVPLSYASARTQAIADVFVEHLDIDNEDAVQAAKGTSRYDQQMDSEGN